METAPCLKVILGARPPDGPCQPMSHSSGGPRPPAQSTTPETLRRNDGQAKQTRNATSFFATGHSTLSFFILDIALALAAPFSSSETTFGTLLGFGDW